MPQHGLLRPLAAAELSDGTLCYILLAAALLSPRPPDLMILNEPEASLHPDLLALPARLMLKAAERCQSSSSRTPAPRRCARQDRQGDAVALEAARRDGGPGSERLAVDVAAALAPAPTRTSIARGGGMLASGVDPQWSRIRPVQLPELNRRSEGRSSTSPSTRLRHRLSREEVMSAMISGTQPVDGS